MLGFQNFTKDMLPLTSDLLPNWSEKKKQQFILAPSPTFSFRSPELRNDFSLPFTY